MSEVDVRSSSDALRLAATSIAPRLARRWVGAACAQLGEDLRAVAELLTSELVSNAVRHPPRGEPDQGSEIEVRLRRTALGLRVEVYDHDERPLPAIRPISTPREGGMGLQLVAELSAAWGVDPAPSGAGKVVWFEIEAPNGDIVD